MLREIYAVGGEARKRYEVKEGERVKGRWIEKERVRWVKQKMVTQKYHKNIITRKVSPEFYYTIRLPRILWYYTKMYELYL